jgi:hypothetical protein
MLKKACVYLIDFYQRHIRINQPSTCRFVPTCSEYAKQAIVKYGFLKGLSMGAKRLLLCHPFSGREGFNPLE